MILNYKETGRGPSLVILHGLFGSLDNWATMAKSLGNYFHVITMDLRNHGNSLHSDDWNYGLMANDVKETLTALNLQKVFMAGHSMGGKTAMEFAARFPECIEKLMVIDISPRYYAPHHQSILNALFSLDLEQIQTRKEAEEKLSQTISDQGTRQFLLKNLYWKEAGKLAWKFNLETIAKKIEIVGEKTPEGNITIQKPILFIKGSSSGYINATDEKNIPEIFPQASVFTIEGAGHWVHAEKPAELFSCFVDFFKP
jgi:esterase